MTRVAIVDYGLGNLASLAGAVEKLDHRPVITADPDVLAAADKLLLPGVGAFGDGMQNLAECGLTTTLNHLVRDGGKPILGICLGAQLVCRQSEEFGSYRGLGWIDADVVRLSPNDPKLRVPHVGWDELRQDRPSPLFDGIPDEALFYYTHTFCIRAADRAPVAGTCDYGGQFDAVLSRNNVYAVQFHPEKSQLHGLRLLQNFIEAA